MCITKNKWTQAIYCNSWLTLTQTVTLHFQSNVPHLSINWTCYTSNFLLPGTQKSKQNSKSWQKLTKKWEVLRCVFILSTSADSQVRSYQLTRLLSDANQRSFGVGINTTFLITVWVLFTLIMVAKAGGCKLNHCSQGLLYHQWHNVHVHVCVLKLCSVELNKSSLRHGQSKFQIPITLGPRTASVRDTINTVPCTANIRDTAHILLCTADTRIQ